jgi:hypothetical protein
VPDIFLFLLTYRLTRRAPASSYGKGMPRALIGVLPHRQLDLEKARTPEVERGHESSIGTMQDQQLRVAFEVIAERQLDPVAPVREPIPDPRKTLVLDGDAFVDHGEVGKPEQLRTPVLQEDVNGGVFGISPEVLYGAPHTGEVALPVAFPHPHRSTPTGFACLHEF